MLRRLSPEAAAQVQAPSAQPASRSAGSGKVTISADVEDADIFLDGKFVGNAPSVLHVSTGTHKIELKNADGKTWARDLEVMDESEVTLKAVLHTGHAPN